MNNIIEAINRAVAEAQERCAAAESQAGIEAVRIDYLGRNGLFPELSRQMGTIPAEERRETGAAFNTGRNQIQKAMDDAMARFADSAADLSHSESVWAITSRRIASKSVSKAK